MVAGVRVELRTDDFGGRGRIGWMDESCCGWMTLVHFVDGTGLDGGDEGILWPFLFWLSGEPMLIRFLSMTDSINGHDKIHQGQGGCQKSVFSLNDMRLLCL